MVSETDRTKRALVSLLKTLAGIYAEHGGVSKSVLCEAIVSYPVVVLTACWSPSAVFVCGETPHRRYKSSLKIV